MRRPGCDWSSNEFPMGSRDERFKRLLRAQGSGTAVRLFGDRRVDGRALVVGLQGPEKAPHAAGEVQDEDACDLDRAHRGPLPATGATVGGCEQRRASGGPSIEGTSPRSSVENEVAAITGVGVLGGRVEGLEVLVQHRGSVATTGGTRPPSALGRIEVRPHVGELGDVPAGGVRPFHLHDEDGPQIGEGVHPQVQAITDLLDECRGPEASLREGVDRQAKHLGGQVQPLDIVDLNVTIQHLIDSRHLVHGRHHRARGQTQQPQTRAVPLGGRREDGLAPFPAATASVLQRPIIT